MTRHWHHLGLVLALMLLPASLDGAETPPCPPTPGVVASQDITRGRCLFHSAIAFGQDRDGAFASCARCHYGSEKTDRSVHLVRVTNRAGQTIEVLRKTNWNKSRAAMQLQISRNTLRYRIDKYGLHP